MKHLGKIKRSMPLNEIPSCFLAPIAAKRGWGGKEPDSAWFDLCFPSLVVRIRRMVRRFFECALSR